MLLRFVCAAFCALTLFGGCGGADYTSPRDMHADPARFDQVAGPEWQPHSADWTNASDAEVFDRYLAAPRRR